MLSISKYLAFLLSCILPAMTKETISNERSKSQGGFIMRKDAFYRLFTVIALVVGLMLPAVALAISEEEVKATMQSINDQIQAMRENVRLEAVEYFTAVGQGGQTIYFDDRTKQSGDHFMPCDPRRGGFCDISWISDQVDGTANGPTLADTQTAVNNAMATWDSTKCSTIPLTKLFDLGLDWGYVQFLLGFGGVPGWWADLTHAGWLPGDFFEAVFGPGGSDVVLGVTFTLVWIDPASGDPTDIDNNGKADVAFRETYYNNAFPWAIDTDIPIDVETVVLHETGHGLSQDHFGKLFETDANGKLHFAPRAVMNAGYTGVQQYLRGTDKGGHCSIWGSWPNK